MAQGHKRASLIAMAVGSMPTWGMKYLILSFSRSGNEAKRGVEFRLSIRIKNTTGGTSQELLRALHCILGGDGHLHYESMEYFEVCSIRI